MGDFQPTVLLSAVVPESLLDIEKTISTIRSSLSEKSSLLSEVFNNIEMKLDKLEQKCSDITNEREKKLKNTFTEKERMEQELQTLRSEKLELLDKIERNKSLCENKVKSDTDEDELCNLMKQVYTLKEEIESRKKNILHDVNEFQNGINHYNKYLQCNVLLEEENVVVFTPNLSAGNVSEVRDYIKFTTIDGNTFQYVDMQPKLQNQLSLIKRYQETGDIQGFILLYLKALGLFKGRKVK